MMYDSNGNEDTSERSMNLVAGLYDMRNQGTFDSQGNMVKIIRAITADDLQQYIEHYTKGGWISSDLSALHDALKALTPEQA